MKGVRQEMLSSRKIWLIMLLVMVGACDPVANQQEMIGSARGYIEIRDYNPAVLELKNVLQEDAGNAEARYLLGQIYLSLGDAKSAEKELLRARDAGWDEARVYLLLAEALFRQAKYQQVLDDIPINETYPPAVRADLLGIRAASEAGLGHWDRAAVTLGSGEAIASDAYWVLYSGIRQQVNAGNITAADETLARALQVYPSSQEMWQLRAGLYEKKGNAAEVEAALQSVIDLEPPKNMTVWGRRARLAKSQALLLKQDYDNATAIIAPILSANAGDPLANYVSALIAFKQGQYDAAEERLLVVLRVAPEHRPTLLLSGTLNFIRSDFEQAAYYLEKATALQPDKLDAQVLLGKTYLVLGQYEEAESRFTMASSMAPDNAELKALIGVSRIRGGDTKAGIRDLELAAESAPADAGVRNELARAYMSTGNTQRAISMLESALQQSEEQQDTEAVLMMAYLSAGEYDKVIDLAHKLSTQFPDNPLPHLAVGMASEASKDFATARRQYDKVLGLDPDQIAALLGHARLDMNEGNVPDARDRYQAVLAIKPDHTEALVALAYLLELEGDIDQAVVLLEKARQAAPGLLEPRLILGNYYLKRGDVEQAMVYAKEAHAINPEDRRVLFVLGKAQLFSGDPEAVPTLLQLTEQAPDFPEAHYYLGLVKIKLRDMQGAHDSLQRALKLNPDLMQARLALGNLEFQRGNTDKALEIARQLQKTYPDSVSGYLLEGDVRKLKKDVNGALAAFASALARAEEADIVVRISRVQKQLGQSQTSYDTLQHWLQKHPDHHSVRLALAMTHMTDGQSDEAMREFRIILETRPDDAVVLNNLAYLLHETGKPGAIEMAERAHRLAPDNPAIHDTYGWLLVQAGRVESGLIALEQAAEKAPGNYDIRYHRAAALARVGQTARAKQELEAILQAGNAFQERGQAEALLEQLSN